MNDIYGLDPAAPNGVKDLKVLCDLFGFTQGRFLANYPHDWLSMLRQRMTNLSDNDRARAAILLKKFLDGAIPVDGKYLRSKDWLTNAIDLQDKERKFRDIISTSDSQSNFPSLEKVLYEDELPDSRGSHIKMDLKSYQFTIAPLFLVSTEIHLQDMYFILEEDGKKLYRQWNILRMFVSQAQSGGRCKTLFFHLNQEKFATRQSEERLENGFSQVLEEQKNGNLKIIYSLEDRKITHGRYIFSIKGGLQFDHGFDTDFRFDNKKNHVHWLSKGELLPLFERYRI